MDFNTIIFFSIVIPTVLSEPLVQLPSGQVLGREAATLENKTFYAFEGIPYAAPPVGSLRFEAPQAPQNWDGVLDATTSNKICFQLSENNDLETEDCLYINVYTPNLPEKDQNVSLPVMFYIYGGAFINGYSEPFGPDLHINNDVILVTFNYRLGIFGFLSTQDEIIPGNNGLKDQKLALRWTYNNIEVFGGNPNKITIFGQSAGAASVAYQMLNADNLGAILQSGSFLSPWAFQRNPRKISFATAALLNSEFGNSNDSQALLDYLKTVSAKDLDAVAEEYHNSATTAENYELFQGFLWAPVMEVQHPGAFLTAKMYGSLQKAQIITVPTLIGVNSEEGLALFPDSGGLTWLTQSFDTNLDWIPPQDMQILDKSNRTEMGLSIRDLYTEGDLFTNDLGAAVRFSSDNAFTRSVIKHAELYSRLSEAYFYQFSYKGELGHGNTPYDGSESVGHSEELYYLFCYTMSCDISDYAESDRITRERLVKLWTDFAKYQNPTPDPSDLLQHITWPPVNTIEGNFYYLDINESLEIKNHPKEETYKGWISLYNGLGYNDFDTY